MLVAAIHRDHRVSANTSLFLKFNNDKVDNFNGLNNLLNYYNLINYNNLLPEDSDVSDWNLLLVTSFREEKYFSLGLANLL